MNKRKDWNKTVTRLYEEMPSMAKVDWKALFLEDPKILGNIINDVIKINVSEKGRPGKRSASSAGDISDDLLKLNRQDYSEHDFGTIMLKQMHARSIRQVANRSGLSKSVVHRLMTKESKPTSIQLEALSKAFNKEPGYFSEYRAAYICAALYEMLVENPASSIVQYDKLRAAEKTIEKTAEKAAEKDI